MKGSRPARRLRDCFKLLEAIYKTASEQNPDAAEMREAEVVLGMTIKAHRYPTKVMRPTCHAKNCSMTFIILLLTTSVLALAR